MRLVAVLGYSSRRVTGLHELCAARLRHAEGIAGASDVVLLSGYGRGKHVAEAELMRTAWQGRAAQLIADRTARSTRENAAGVAEVARRLHLREVTLVTSRWHAFRAGMLVRAALPHVSVQTSSPPGRPPAGLFLREVACLVALPFHLIRLRTQA
jgi:uncharacterized SAM-binding protein YcdF (DUF218 family)